MQRGGSFVSCPPFHAKLKQRGRRGRDRVREEEMYGRMFMKGMCALAVATTMGGCSKKEKATDAPYPTEWNLDDLYPSADCAEFQTDKASVMEEAEAFAKKYKGHLTVDNLSEALKELEKGLQKLMRLGAYVELSYQVRLHDPKASALYQEFSELGARASAAVAFFQVECLSLPYDVLQERMRTDSDLARYRVWIEDVFRNRAHILSAAEEQILAKTSVIAGDAWHKFYDELLAKVDFKFEGATRKLEFVLHKMAEGKTDRERRAAAQALSRGLSENAFLFKSIYNNILLDRQVKDDLRHYASPEAARLTADAIDPAIVNAMIEAVKKHYVRLSHRYYRLKARLMKQEKLQYWDRSISVNLTEPRPALSYAEAIQSVFEVYGRFSSTFERIAREFVTKGWIDVFPRDGKTSGAFACSASVDAHPFVLLNFMGSQRDLLTIAHELGHGVHQYLSRGVGQLQADPALALSETASTFAEKLTYESLIAKAISKREKIQLMCGALDDFMNTVVRQTAFYCFEQQAHAQRKKGEVAAETFDALWRQTQVEALGDGVVIDPCVDNFWMYVSHFFASPFYVYSYVFGRLFVEAFHNAYEKDPKEFRTKYEQLLSKGGTILCEEAAKMFGFDLRSSAFWEETLHSAEKQIEELEELCKEEGL